MTPSAAPQCLLQRWLGLPSPDWWHVPLIRDQAGRRLAKRDGDEGLQSLRARGVRSERIAGLVGWSVGLHELAPIAPADLPRVMDPARVAGGLRELEARGGLRVTAAMLAWLAGDDAAADMLRLDARGGTTR